MKEKLVLAFSGGLDTSFCVKYLTEEKGFEVYTTTANTVIRLRSSPDRRKDTGSVRRAYYH